MKKLMLLFAIGISLHSEATTIRDSIVGGSSITVRYNGSASIKVGVKYGTSPYTYAWSDGQSQTTATATLTAGSYTVTVTDAASGTCTASVVVKQTPPGNTFGVVSNLSSTVKNPFGNLIRLGNRLYGISSGGYGTVFSMDTNGGSIETTLTFNGANGANPFGSLVASGVKLFGMTYWGGKYNFGCIFKVDTDGTQYKDILDFNGTNGAYPHGTLIISGVKLFGMTTNGGTGQGNIFKIDTNGTQYKNLHSFTGNDGANPIYGALLQSGYKLFGMTELGGTNGSGVVFKIDSAGGAFQVLHNFNYGDDPQGSLILPDTLLYGMTQFGGNKNGAIFSCDTSGKTYQKIYSFNGNDGNMPYGSLVVNTDTLYGMTYTGGIGSIGNVFKVTKQGTLYKDLYDFPYNQSNGANPYGTLFISNGILYGTTKNGGSNGVGVIFNLY